jgi:serine/threonine-protein kinase
VNQPPAPPSSHVKNIDPNLESVVMRSLAKDPAQRYPDGTAFAEALRENAPAGTAVMAGAAAAAVTGDTAVLQTDDFDWDEPPPPSKDSVGKAILMGLAIGLVVLAVFIGVMLLVRDSGDDDSDNSGPGGGNGGGGGPGPGETTEEIAPEPDQPEEEPPAPEEEEPPPDEEESPPEEEEPDPGLVPDEGDEGGGGEGPPDPPTDEATSEVEVGGGGNGGGD